MSFVEVMALSSQRVKVCVRCSVCVRMGFGAGSTAVIGEGWIVEVVERVEVSMRVYRLASANESKRERKEKIVEENGIPLHPRDLCHLLFTVTHPLLTTVPGTPFVSVTVTCSPTTNPKSLCTANPFPPFSPRVTME